MNKPTVTCRTVDRSHLYPWQEESLKKMESMDYSKLEERVMSSPNRIGKTGAMIANMLEQDHKPLIIQSLGPKGPTLIQGKYEMLYHYSSKMPVIAYLANNPAFRNPKNKLPRGAQRKVDKIARQYKNANSNLKTNQNESETSNGREEKELT